MVYCSFDREKETKASAMWEKEDEVEKVSAEPKKRRTSSVDEPINMREETMVSSPFSL